MSVSGIDPEVLELAREEANERVMNIERNLLGLEDGSIGEEAINALFRDAHSIKSAAAMLGWDEAMEIAHAMEDTFDECREGKRSLRDLTDPLLTSLDSLKTAVSADSIDSGPTAVAPDEASGTPANGTPANGTPANGTPANGAPANGTPPDAPAGQSIRVAAPKVDRMLDAVGETVLHQRRLEHLLATDRAATSEDEAEEELDLGSRLLGELHDSVIGMRTLPLSSITAPFARSVRDLAAEEGREVQLRITGAETQLDRVILEGLGEVINHLLRNAIAHGIESPDEREAAGKERRGTITLRAEQREGMVALEIGDDGRGVPADLLAGTGDDVSLADALAAPGFTTTETVSDVSGRGVGLDAVKKHVEALAGSVDVQSQPGEGMTVTLLLPLTLALQRLLMCERAGQIFGLPLTSVREVVTVTDPVSLGGRPSLELRGEAVPLEDLATALGASAPELAPGAPAMVIGGSGRRLAISCDSVIGDQEVVVKSLGPLLASVRGYLGAAILGDGRVAMIVDPNHLLRRPDSGPAPARSLAPPEEAAPAPMVLVVDDQFTVRELQRSILETAGYRVETARDGREALERIGRNGVDMVLTDVEMPEMTGFELLHEIRADPERGDLPVVIVSAQSGEDDRRRGAEEGADAYIVKQEYDQHALIDVIERLVRRQ
jgi:two-component system, chemotaxis family, sensor kinase CheA